jgi:hypothetical protein
MKILNSDGAEQLGLGLKPVGHNRTRARLRIALESADVPTVQLLDWPDETRILVRQVGFSRDTVLEWRR